MARDAIAHTIDLAQHLGVAGADAAAQLIAEAGADDAEWTVPVDAVPGWLQVAIAAEAPAVQPFVARTRERAVDLPGRDAVGVIVGPGVGAGAPVHRWWRLADRGADHAWLAGIDAVLPELVDDARWLAGHGALRAIGVAGQGERTTQSAIYAAVPDAAALLAVLERAAIPADDDGRVFCRGLVGLGGAGPWPRLWVRRALGAGAGWALQLLAGAGSPPDLAILDAAAAPLRVRDGWGLLARVAAYRPVIAAATWEVLDALPAAPRPSRWTLRFALP